MLKDKSRRDLLRSGGQPLQASEDSWAESQVLSLVCPKRLGTDDCGRPQKDCSFAERGGAPEWIQLKQIVAMSPRNWNDASSQVSPMAVFCFLLVIVPIPSRDFVTMCSIAIENG